MAKILFFAATSAVYPTMVALAILIFARPKPVKLFSGFLIGGMIVSLVAGMVILTVVGTESLGPGSRGAARPVLSLTVGLLLIAVGATLLLGHDLPGAGRRARRKEKKQELAVKNGSGESRVARFVARDSFWLALGVGAALNLPSVRYVSALAEIDSMGLPTFTDLLIVLLYNVIMFSLIELSLAFCLFAPERAAAAVTRLDVWTRSHLRDIGIAVALIGGIYFVVKALITLL